MNTENHNDAEQRLRETYLASQDVRAPDSLNRAVLDEATAAVKPGFAKYLSVWGRPLAFAATFVLGIALVYDMQGLTPLPANETSSESAVSLPTSSDTASDDNAPASREMRQMREEKRSAAEPLQSAPSQGQDSGDTSANLLQLNKFGNSRRSTRPSNAKADQTLNETAQSPAESRTVQDSLAPSAVAARADTAYTDSRDSDRQCQTSEMQGADEWWQCIVELREAGDDEGAGKEQTLLKIIYPDFSAPE
ncbi:MAG: hypothetical protein RIA65_09025 [Woeseia sp.]